MDLSRELVKFMETASSDATVDDFFDHCKMSQKQRSDFVMAAILNGAGKIWDEEEFWDKIRRHNNVNSNG